MGRVAGILLMAALPGFQTVATAAEPPDLIVHHGKVVTVDAQFSIREAMAIRGGRIISVGNNDDILKLKGAATQLIDAQGHMVLPGLMDSHTHPEAAMTEFDHPIPEMETVQQVLDYIRDRSRVVPKGEWIQVSQIFITRLREQRYPTRAELDQTAPEHPVVFATGPDASLNTLALKLSGGRCSFSKTTIQWG